MPDETSTTPEAAPTDLPGKIESGKNYAKKAADDLRTAAEAKAAELRKVAEGKATELRGQAEKAYEDVSQRARTLREDGEHYVKENPTRAVLAALGFGFLVGLIFRR